MSNITNADAVVTEQKLTEFYNDIKPFLGCPAYVTQEGDAEYYSTDEKVIGRWADGKPLYQKVIYVDSLTFSSVTEKNIDTSALLDKDDIIVKTFYGSYYCDVGTNTEQHHNFGYEKVSNTEYYYSAYYRQAEDIIKVRGTWGGINPWTIYRILFIIKYTKKSDSAVTTIEQKPTHYSTEEQVVGKWIDGKPIYQKTIPITLSSAGDNQIAHNISNVDTIMADLSSSYVKVGSETFVLSCINQGSGSYINDVNLNWINATKLNIIAGANRLGSGYVTLRYTKTTD